MANLTSLPSSKVAQTFVSGALTCSPWLAIKDPPFSRLDLISCRNLLIYLNSHAQRRVMDSFHYALRHSSRHVRPLVPELNQSCKGCLDGRDLLRHDAPFLAEFLRLLFDEALKLAAVQLPTSRKNDRTSAGSASETLCISERYVSAQVGGCDVKRQRIRQGGNNRTS